MRKRKEQPAYKLGLKYMQENCGMTAVQLTESLGIARRNISQYIKLWREDGIKIVGWEPTKRGYAPIYGFGQRDITKPKPKTGAENSLKYRKKLSAMINLKKRTSRLNQQ